MWNAFCLAAGEGFGVRYGWSIGKQSTGLLSLRRETRPFRATDNRSNYSNPCRLRKKTAVPNGTTVFLAAGEGFEIKILPAAMCYSLLSHVMALGKANNGLC